MSSSTKSLKFNHLYNISTEQRYFFLFLLFPAKFSSAVESFYGLCPRSFCYIISIKCFLKRLGIHSYGNKSWTHWKFLDCLAFQWRTLYMEKIANLKLSITYTWSKCVWLLSDYAICCYLIGLTMND